MIDTKNIMIVDDDMHIGNMLTEALVAEGYEVTRAYSGTEAVMVLEKKQPDLVLLDLMLPGMDGEEVLPLIKDIPVIVMSAKAGIQDKVNLLMAGASDYVTKPFENKVCLDTDLLMVKVENTEISLTRTEAAILKILMSNPGRPVGRGMILDRISFDTPDCTERSLKQHISNIRKKLMAVNGVDYIAAVYGIGFKFSD